MSDFLVSLQKLLPQHALSRILGRVAETRNPLIARPLMRLFSAAFAVSLDDAGRRSLADYASFNDFFTRELAPGARPMPADPAAVACPADGILGRHGRITDGTLLQAKGIEYRLGALLTDETAARAYEGGWYATIYLAPANYHRVHAPCSGHVVRTIAVPGALFSVNARTETALPGLFARNERLVSFLDTEWGSIGVVLVGALIVASIETVWGAPQSPYRRQREERLRFALARGAELGRFRMGSTVILLLPPGTFAPSALLAPGRHVRVGETLGSWAA